MVCVCATHCQENENGRDAENQVGERVSKCVSTYLLTHPNLCFCGGKLTVPKLDQEVSVMKRVSLLLSLVALVSLTVHAEGWEVLVVDAVAEPGFEFQLLSDNVKEAHGEAVNYTQIVTTNLKSETLGNYTAVWLGWNCSSDDGGYFRQDDGDVIADYVEAGGVLIASATDNAGWKSDWLPAAFTVLDTGDYGLEVTEEGEALFSSPNDVDTNAPIMDERYSAIDDAYTILAWDASQVGSEAGVLQIALGKGLYLMASLDNRNAGNTQLNIQLMENMLNYAIAYAEEARAIEPMGKLSTTWAGLKSER
jgi:hypothetical protein